MSKRYRLLIIAVVFLILFAFLSKFEDRTIVRTVDFATTVRVQDAVARFCTSKCDSLFDAIGLLASPMVSVAAVLVLMVMHRKQGIRALLIPLLFVALTFAEIYGKSVVRHPAPPFFMLKNPTTIFPAYHVIEQFSYPSGHAARAVFLSVLLWQQTIGSSLVFAAYVGVTVFAKIYLGQHWLSDIMGGVLLGGAMALLCRSMFASRALARDGSSARSKAP